jgi:hypothetical protein
MNRETGCKIILKFLSNEISSSFSTLCAAINAINWSHFPLNTVVGLGGWE